MSLIQLNPPIPLNTPKGPGLCHVLIDYGPESHLYWVVILDSNGEIWTFENPEVRGQNNPTMGRELRGESPIKAILEREKEWLQSQNSTGSSSGPIPPGRTPPAPKVP
jgi:hypothetical protein